MFLFITKFFKQRLIVAIISFYIAGILISSVFGFDNALNLFLTLGLAAVILTVISLIFKRSFIGISVVLCTIAFICGSLHISHIDNTRQLDLRQHIGQNGWIYGTVISTPDLGEGGKYYSIVVDINKFETKEKTLNLDGKMRLFVSVRDKTAPIINENIYCYTTLTAPDFTEGTFDYSLYLKTKSIYATGFTNLIYPDTNYVPQKTPISVLKTFGRNLNMFFRNRIENIFDYDTDACALVKGILLGDKSDFSETLTSNFSKAGFSHIAAVSGLHLNILFGAFCGLLGFFRVRKKIVAGIVLPVILLFAAITDFSPSVSRAAIMLTIHLFALLIKRQYDSLNALFISALIILAINPYALFNISFILSFTATLGIIIIFPRIYAKFSRLADKSKILRFFLSSLAISIAAFLGTAPFVAYYFGQISISSFIGNIWVIPLCGPIFILGYISCIITMFLPEFICNLIIYPLAALLEIVIKTAEISAKIKFLSPSIPAFSPYFILIYFIVIGLLFARNYDKKGQHTL